MVKDRASVEIADRKRIEENLPFASGSRRDVKGSRIRARYLEPSRGLIVT